MMQRILAVGLLLLSGAGAAGFLYHEQPDPSPYLKAVTPIPACDFNISTDAGWAEINNPAYRVFCVAPGDYTALGRIQLTADGTSSAPRWIRYAGPAADSVHPYAMATGDRAQIQGLYLNGADYWVISRISVNAVTSTLNDAVFLAGADDNVFDRVDAYATRANAVTFYAGSDNNTVQYSTIHDGRISDGAGVFWNSWNIGSAVALSPALNNRLVSSEIWNMADAVQFAGENNMTANEDYSGAVVYNNDLYSTTSRYKDCAGSYNTAGPCSIDENGIDIKSAAQNAASPVLIAHNRIWGWRATDPVSAGGSDSWGDVVVLHYGVSNLRIEGNALWDGPRLLGASGSQSAVSVTDNLLHAPYPYSKPGQTGFRALLDTTTVHTSVLITDNVLSQMPGTVVGSVGVRFAVGTSGVSYSNNALVDVALSELTTTPFAGTITGNAYYSAADTKPAWDTGGTYIGASADSVYDNQWCTTVKRLTSPETVCFAKALHDANVATDITRPSNFGVDD